MELRGRGAAPWQGVVELLACPSCKGDLTVVAGDALSCASCGKSYPVIGDVPRLLPSEGRARAAQRTSDSFAVEFTELEPLEISPRKSREDVVTFFRATGLDPGIYARVRNAAKRLDLTPEDIGYEPSGSGLAGARVLDAGCGAGRFAILAARYGARVVGLDASEAVNRARVRTEGLDVSIVQGDVLDPPLKSASFDIVFSIGVLHHTLDTRAGIRALASLLKPGGILAVWVYPPEYWAGPVRSVVTRLLRKPLLQLPARARGFIVEQVLYPIGRLQMRLAQRRWTKWLCAPLFVLNIPRHAEREVMIPSIYDYWSPPIIRTHRAEELYDWFAETGLEEIEILPTPTAVRGRRPA